MCTRAMRLLLRMTHAAALAAPAWADCPADCPARCPEQRAAQSDWVRQHFSLDKFWGTYYELQARPGFPPYLPSEHAHARSA